MLIRDMDITLIKPYERNPRNNDKAIDAVAKSIQEFGWNSPIVVDRDNVIVCGHSRWRAAQKLGLTTVPVYVADKLTPEQVQAYRIADNKTAELADWNYDLLPLELRALQDAQYDLTLLGFDTGELEKLLAGEDNVFEGETDPDAIPAVPEMAASCLGEIYQLGSHRLLCGSSTDENDVARLMEGTKAKMLFTSPPYSDMRDYNGGKDLSVENLVSFIGCYLPYTDYQCVNWGCNGVTQKSWNTGTVISRQLGKQATRCWPGMFGTRVWLAALACRRRCFPSGMNGCSCLVPSRLPSTVPGRKRSAISMPKRYAIKCARKTVQPAFPRSEHVNGLKAMGPFAGDGRAWQHPA